MNKRIVPIEESIEEFFQGVFGPNDPPLSLDSEMDRCWAAGWMRATAERLGPCGISNHYANMVKALDIPSNQKEWTNDPKWN